MPELPEVEVCRRGLQPELTGERILGAIVRSPRLRLPLLATLGDTLAGQQVVAVRRRGKYLLLDCRGAAEDGCLIIHLGMSGNLRLVANDKTPGKHDHVDILFARQTLRLADPRRFGVVLWQAVGKAPHPLLAALGIEPLTDEFTGDWLFAATRRRAGPIKPVLMDSHLAVSYTHLDVYKRQQFRCAKNDRGSHVDRGMQHEIGCRRQFDIAEGLADTLGKRIAAMNENGNVGAEL